MTEQRKKAWRDEYQAPFDLERYGDLLVAVLDKVRAVPKWSQRKLGRIIRQHPLPDGKTLSKSQMLKGYAQLCALEGQEPDPELVRRLRAKPTRTISGVAPVAVLTKPAPCPGECIFCPTVEQMPKSYLPDEPGAMRAANHDFDPYDQTAGRIAVMSEIGHNVDKVELLILGGTWSCYPEDYQEWFVRRCLDAMNGVEASTLENAQRLNEQSRHRNVGLVVETRPDRITPEEVQRLRWLGATKVQLGVQSLDDDILARNRRGHTLAETRRAIRLLRLAGFKIVVHWMPNLLGATPESDLEDFGRLFNIPAIRPDEMKIYPTALLSNTALYEYWQRGEYQPYDEKILTDLLVRCKILIPAYCRINRLMRDIPAPNIVAGVTKSNLRQIVQLRMKREGLTCRCVRCREVRGQAVDADALEFEQLDYDTDATRESFLSYVTPQDQLAGFLRLSLPLPETKPTIAELDGCAVIREVHVYGPALELGARQQGMVQHAGLGTQLIDQARRVARKEGFSRLAVIAAVGTRPYYQERGFTLGRLYMIGKV
ncbi:MAG: tRNA uridine(34) 5-carboxymethylaminomethyl modification radical SAM/GNAT enzyme Elp3 [Chloroflexi bacterium]|nr:tRNA uridine(34) 5-carboxymethylaminomethyl modification radical SAM/GNAT enzyme Elp3 [Chloroflexota bacterium]